MFVVSTGMVCSVGLTAAAGCAAMRAGIAKFDELPYRDGQGEPIVGATVPNLDFDVKRDQRLIELLAMAIADCLGEKPSMPTSSIPLLVGLAEEGRPGGGALANTIVADVQSHLKWKFHPHRSRGFAKGHTAGFEALRVVRELLQHSDIPACLVCGVDSYINGSSLWWLDKNWRLKTPANQHAVIPGEGAAAILVQRASVVEAGVEVIGMGFGREPVNVLSEEPLLGLGLTEAARGALTEAKLAFHELDWKISDVTGEQYGFKELPLVEGRLVRVVRKAPQPIWHCADSIGDCGAAAGVMQLVVADKAFRKGYAPGETAICFASSVPGDRAALVIRRGMR